MKRLFIPAIVSVVILALPFAAFAGGQSEEDFPSKEITGYIMWGAGGATDVFARSLSPHVEEALGKSLVLVNKPGGTGAVATEYVNNQPADGYTLLMGAENPQIYRVLGLSDLDYRDFYPINVSARSVGVIVVQKDAPWDTFQDLLDEIHENPGEVKMGSTGPGGIPFTVGSMIEAVTEFEVTKVPFDGEGPGITALMGGHVDFMPSGLSAAREYIRGDRLKALAVVAEKEMEGLEEYPLITDTLPELEKYLPWGPFYGVFCRNDVPDDRKKMLVDAFKKGVSAEKFQETMKSKGNVIMNISGEEAKEYLATYQSTTCWLYHGVGETKVSPQEVGIPKP